VKTPAPIAADFCWPVVFTSARGISQRQR